MATLLIAHADWLITMDAERRIFTDGAVAIDKDRIIAVGKSQEILNCHQAGNLFDARGKLVLPGLINAHAGNAQQR